jgi:polyvinyl alcohol dehydrogenase (cytochrome)
MKRTLLIFGALAGMCLGAANFGFAQSTEDLRAYEQHCASCHQNPSAPAGTPDGMALRNMTPEAVMAALDGAKHPALQGVTDDDKKLIAGYLGGRKPDVAKVDDAKLMPNQCAKNPGIETLSGKPLWNGWGADLENTRFQPAKMAQLSAEQVPNLKLKWAFGFPAAEIMWGQPTIAAGRVFIGVDTGAVYSLDADTGCVHWSFQSDAGVRNAITVAPVKGQGAAKYAAFFGDVKGNVYGIDATSGKLLWKVQAEDHPLTRITGAPIYYDERLYVPTASSEERAAGMSKTYPCCTFRGSVLALDANTGKQIWKTYIIPDPPKPTKKTSNGVQLYAPSGGAVWNTPTIDPKNHALYIGTGDAYNHPAGKTTDAIMALDLATGKVLWAAQDTENDAWLAGCEPPNSENCPEDIGPDYDFGASPILRTLPNGRRILIAGQKSGIVWGHDPDKQGAVEWKVQLSKELARGMITFGGAADEQRAYFGLRSGGIGAIDISNGEKEWFTPIAVPQQPKLRGGQTAALTAIPGVVFSDGEDGVVRALSADDGHKIWEYNTVQDFKTVNKVAAHGGSMGSAGPTVAGGMVFVGSGYTFGNGQTGNVLLAFSAK